MAANYEMLSFIGKFNQMTSCGFYASLNFSCQNGRVSVQMSADLGCLNPGLNPYPAASFSNRSCDRPSKVRRRHRRSQSKKDAEVLNVEILDAKINTQIAPSQESIETQEFSASSHIESEQDLSVLDDENLPDATLESQQATDEENPMVETAVVQCSLCQNQAVSFSRRTEFLRHICVDHFGEEHLVDFPEFLPNDVFRQAMTLSI